MTEDQEPSRHRRVRTVTAGLMAAVLVAGIGVAAYVRSPAHALHSPNHDLQQIDLFYLDEPAPLAARAGVTPGRVTLLMICGSCDAPAVDAEIVTTDDPAIAQEYGLVTAAGRVGPGYAIIDADGNVRYRTFDAAPGDHGDEIRVLIDNAR